MKRSFLCGLAVALIVGGFGMLFFGHVALTKSVSTWAGATSWLASGFVVWAARVMPPSKSWWIAILFWILGYVAGGIVLFPVFYIFGEMPSYH
jgi:hypothetical protein